MSIKNSVTVQFKSSSYLLAETSPIEIRDSNLNLVEQLRHGQQVELDDGLYEISAVLQDGQKHRRLVHLQGGSREEVVLDAQEAMQLVHPPPPRVKMTSSPEAESGHGSFPDLTAGAGSDTAMTDLNLGPYEPEGPIELVESDGAVLRESRTTVAGGSSWFFEPSPDLDTVPRAYFRIHGRKIAISLPVNPESHYPLNACEVVTKANAGALEVRAWISPERTVASTMQHMLASGYLLHAARIASEAIELLRSKYQDPTGALLGALLLQKIGQLEPRRSWVENLARDFDWLNDGKVLLALLLSREEAQQDEALTLVLRASKKPMMFTESYSLLLNLLRRWPWPYREDERHKALESLAMMTPYINWDSMMFCQMNAVEE